MNPAPTAKDVVLVGASGALAGLVLVFMALSRPRPAVQAADSSRSSPCARLLRRCRGPSYPPAYRPAAPCLVPRRRNARGLRGFRRGRWPCPGSETEGGRPAVAGPEQAWTVLPRVGRPARSSLRRRLLQARQHPRVRERKAVSRGPAADPARRQERDRDRDRLAAEEDPLEVPRERHPLVTLDGTA